MKLSQIQVAILFVAVGLLAGYLISSASAGSGLNMQSYGGAPVQNGSLVYLDYTLGITTQNGATVIATTDKDVAVSTGSYNPFTLYEPINMTVGSSSTLPALSANVIGMKEGEEKVFTLQPEQAYGLYDNRLLAVVPLDTINSAGPLQIGSRVSAGDSTGLVSNLNATHALVDFNNPLAGQTLIYKVKIINVV